VRDLHPEFGYIGTPTFCRGLIAFVVFGLVAGASCVTLFKADPDPTSAMALAPAEALSSAARSTTTGIAESNSGKGEFAQKMPDAIKPRCQKNATEHLGGDCVAGQTRRPRPILAINERPAIAAVPIGHRDDPAVLPPEPAAPVVAALPEDAETGTPAEAMPSVEPTFPASPPAVAPTKMRERHGERAQRRESDRAQRREREHREYASTPRHYSNRQAGGYAGLW
jgi:hypothetical protein